VDERSWKFERGGQQLRLQRRQAPDGLYLVVTAEDSPTRSYFFHDLATLIPFQTDMESFLISTGWTFVGFDPDRRTGRERRTFPRLDERRRWWTDGRPRPARARVPSTRKRSEG
jgi:hypothetical protein